MKNFNSKHFKLIGVFFALLLVAIFQPISCSVVDSGEVGIKFHKWAANDEDYGGVEGTCKGWVFYNGYTTDVFTYPSYVQRKEYGSFNVTAKDGTIFTMDNIRLAYQINQSKACDIFIKYRKSLAEIEDGYMKTCISEAYRICGNAFTSDSLMSHRAEFEAAVKAKLTKSLNDEGFEVTEFTQKIDPPASLVEMINAKNRAIQSALKSENEVKEAEANAKIAIAKAKGEAEAMKIKADGEAYYNRTISNSLSDLIIREDMIEKWDGHLPQISGGGNMMFDVSKLVK